MHLVLWNGLDISVALNKIKTQCGDGTDDFFNKTFFKLYRY